jgi:hypothetical protein
MLRKNRETETVDAPFGAISATSRHAALPIRRHPGGKENPCLRRMRNDSRIRLASKRKLSGAADSGSAGLSGEIAAQTLFRIGSRSMCSVPDDDAECVLTETLRSVRWSVQVFLPRLRRSSVRCFRQRLSATTAIGVVRRPPRAIS